MKLSKWWGSVAANAIAAACLGAPQLAQAQDNPDSGIDFTFTPRVQTLYSPNVYGAKSGDFSIFTSYGGTVGASFKGTPFAFSATMLSGNRNGTTNDAGIQSKERFNRHDAGLQVFYSPSSSNITLIGGLRQFIVKSTQFRQLPPANPNSGGGIYRDEWLVGEAGARIGGRLGENSKSALSVQMTIGLGRVETTEKTMDSTGTPVLAVTRFSDTGPGAILEAAVAYNYFLTDRLSLGARLRSFTLYKAISGDGSGTSDDVSTAVGPELNLSFNF